MVNKSYCHRGGREPLLGVTIPEHFAATVERFPNHEALVSVHQQRRFTYSELADRVDRVARALMACGFGKGDRIGIWSTNNVEWVLLQLATARIGAILVTINPAYRGRELTYALERSEVQGLFAIPAFRSSDYASMLVDAMPELGDAGCDDFQSDAFPSMRRVVLYQPEDPENTVKPAVGFTVWQEFAAQAARVEQADLDKLTASLDRDDPINIQYTSGTTGFPKAVMLTHHNILNNAWFSAKAMRFGESDRLCIPVPFYHCFGMVLANLLCFSVGACAVMPCEHFDAEAVLRALESEGCTGLHGVPTMFIAELEHERFETYRLHTLRTGIIAGAPCPPALMEKVMERMGCREILIGYGETEASPLTHLTAIDDSPARRIETVGRNLPHQEVKIVELKDGSTVPLGETGEVCFRGYHVMRCYYGDPKATEEAVDSAGWLHSGDLGEMDEEGYVKITGRLKEMIIRAGENIYPREIEDFIFTHEKVAQVAVFGVPDPFYGEEVAAWIHLRAGRRATAEEILEYCRGNLAHYKIPKTVRFVDSFPMTVTGKLQKFRIREMEVEMREREAVGGSGKAP